MSRPSTSCCKHRKDVDARVKPGHDELLFGSGRFVGVGRDSDFIAKHIAACSEKVPDQSVAA